MGDKKKWQKVITLRQIMMRATFWRETVAGCGQPLYWCQEMTITTCSPLQRNNVFSLTKAQNVLPYRDTTCSPLTETQYVSLTEMHALPHRDKCPPSQSHVLHHRVRSSITETHVLPNTDTTCPTSQRHMSSLTETQHVLPNRDTTCSPSQRHIMPSLTKIQHVLLYETLQPVLQKFIHNIQTCTDMI